MRCRASCRAQISVSISSNADANEITYISRFDGSAKDGAGPDHNQGASVDMQR